MTDKELIQALRGYSCQEWTIPNKAADRLEALLAENERLKAQVLSPSTEGGGVMKCTECPEYSKCRSRYDLRIKRHRCLNAKEPKVYTNADHIRAMPDEKLVDFLWQFNTDSFENVMPFCKNTEECGEKLDSADISTEMCKRCLLEKLRQPYESEGMTCST